MTSPSSSAAPTVLREPFLACVAKAMSVGALSGAALGALEALKLLVDGEARYARWATHLVGIAFTGYAATGALIALPCACVAWFLWRAPDHRAAQPSVCAGLGSFLGLAAFVAFDSVGTAGLVPIALASTLLTLALREILAWWSFFDRAGTWWSIAVLVLAADVLFVAVRLGEGTPRLSGALVATSSVLFVLTRRIQARKFGAVAVNLATILLLAAGLSFLERSPFPASRGASSSGGAASPKNVLLVSIDTLRADHLGCYGYAKANTPVIDALAREGCLFEDATSQANTTNPSHTSILTGLYPAEHGAVSNGVHLSSKVSTLADILSSAGYATAAFVSGFTLEHRACGLDQRFDWYDDRLFRLGCAPYPCERLRLMKSVIRLAARRGIQLERSDRPAQETIDSALAWLESPSRDAQPFFLWVHLYDPHGNYEPPPAYAAMHDPDWKGKGAFKWYAMDTEDRQEIVDDARAQQHMIALYDGEISYADAQVGRLLAHLEARGLADDTLVVLTADHGEGLTTHGYYFDHGSFLYDDELHVPLIVRFPDGAHAGKRVAGQTRLIDVAPTVMDALQRKTDVRFTGTSLLPAIDGTAPASERPSFALADMAGSVSGFPMEGRRLSLRNGAHKVIWSSPHWLDTELVPEKIEFFDLSRDPREEHDALPSGDVPPELFEKMVGELDRWREATEAIERDEPLSPEVAEHLRSLGYL